MPRLFMIGGPNGAGKTTSALSLLPHDLSCPEFVNADAIANGLSPYCPDSVALQAGRLMLERIRHLAKARQDFAFETTMASRSFVTFLRSRREESYEIHVIYLWIRSPELALARVARRVREGGHDVPEEVVRRRYLSGIRNLFNLYMPLSDTWTVYDNSMATPRRVAQQLSGGNVFINDLRAWRVIQEMGK